jgi:hypothetical protein
MRSAQDPAHDPTRGQAAVSGTAVRRLKLPSVTRTTPGRTIVAVRRCAVRFAIVSTRPTLPEELL